MNDTVRLIPIAKILSAHGVRGLVKLRCYLDDADNLADYEPICDSKGKAYKITLKNSIKGDWLAEINGITDRNESEKLRGIELFIRRDQLPDIEDGEYYIEDIIGCAAIDKSGTKIGDVVGFENFGASDLVEIKPVNGGKTYYLPMVEPYVGKIDVNAGTIEVEPAEEFMA